MQKRDKSKLASKQESYFQEEESKLTCFNCTEQDKIFIQQRENNKEDRKKKLGKKKKKTHTKVLRKTKTLK